MPPAAPARPIAAPDTSRRRELIATAKRLFLERGYSQTSVASIVREAGVAQGTFYRYFKSKQAVLPYLRAEVLGHYTQAFEENMTDAARPSNVARLADVRLVAGLARIHEVMREQVPLIRVLREATSSEEIEQIWLE